MTNRLMVYVTCSNKEEAKGIAEYVIGQRFAACANIFPAHESLYWWDRAVQNEQEVAMILKTTKERYHELENAIKEKHSYDVPCIVALPIENGNHAFLDWIKEQVSD